MFFILRELPPPKYRPGLLFRLTALRAALLEVTLHLDLEAALFFERTSS